MCPLGECLKAVPPDAIIGLIIGVVVLAVVVPWAMSMARRQMSAAERIATALEEIGRALREKR